MSKRSDGWTLHLVGGPRLVRAGREVSLPEGSKRLVSFVALNGGRVPRRRAGGILWPEADPHRAAGNLRSAMWRLRGAGIDVLRADKSSISLGPGTHVDVERFFDWARRVMGNDVGPDDLDFLPEAVRAFDLLPGWYEDWVILEREQLRQALLPAVEALAHHLADVSRYADAVEAALVAVSVEPLRESAQRTLIMAHLAEGNRGEALRSYRFYEQVLDREMGLRPSPAVWRLLHRATASLAHHERARTGMVHIAESS